MSHWPIDEAPANVGYEESRWLTDTSGSSNDAWLDDGVLGKHAARANQPTSDTAAKLGHGAQSFIEATWPVAANNSYTVSAWARYNGSGGGGYLADLPGLFRLQFDLYDGQLDVDVYDGLGTLHEFSSSRDFAVLRWQHVALRVSGSYANLYIDGHPAGTIPLNGVGAATTGEPLRFGDRRYDSYTSWNGELDDIRIYDGALSEATIEGLAVEPYLPNHSCTGSTPYEQLICDNTHEDPVAYWRLGEGTSNLVNETTANFDTDGWEYAGAIGGPGAISESIPGTKDRATYVQEDRQHARFLDADGYGYLHGPEFTAEVWAAHDADVSYTGHLMYHDRRWSLTRDRDGRYIFSGRTTEDPDFFELKSVPQPAETWIHVAGVFDEQSAKLYIDGELAAEKVFAAPNQLYSRYQRFYLGHRWSNDSFSGWLDEAAYYDDALTADEIASHALRNPEGQLRARASSPHFVINHAEEADPVNTANGAYVTTTTDLTLPSIGIPFSFDRTYTSAATTDTSTLGGGWTHNFDARLEIDGTDIRFWPGDGSYIDYHQLPDGSYATTPGVTTTLTTVTGGYQLTQQDGTTQQFNTNGELTAIADRNGQGLTVTPDANGHTGTVTTTAGETATFTYDTNGLLTDISTSDGRTVAYGYTNGLLTTVTDVRGNTHTYTYNTDGRLTESWDANGHRVVLNTYDPTTGRVDSQTDAEGNLGTFDWDHTTGTSTYTDAAGNTKQDIYRNGVLIAQVDELGNRTDYTYNIRGDRTSSTNPNDDTTSWTYDDNHNRLTETDPAGRTQTWTYNNSNQPTSWTRTDNETVTYTYDTAGNLTTLEEPADDGTTHTTSHTIDPTTGLRTATTDPENNSWTYTHNTAGQLTETTTPAGLTTTHTYNAAGDRTSTVAPRGNQTGNTPADYTTSWTHDPAGNLLTETNPDGNTTTWTYDNVGNRTTQQTELGRTTTWTYDDTNRLLTVTPPTGATTTHTYDAVGNRVSSTTDGDTTTYGYDAAGQLTTVTNPNNETVNHTYDNVGNRTSTTDARNNTTNWTYDNVGRITQVTAADGATTNYAYDDLDQLVSRTDDNNNTTTYSYTTEGWLQSTTNPENSTWTYTHNAVGQVTSETDAIGNSTSYSRDADGRILTVDHPAGTPDVHHTYDGDVPATITDGAGTTTYTHDTAGRLTQVERTNSYSSTTDTLTYTYNDDGQLEGRTQPDGTTDQYLHDPTTGQLTTIAEQGGTTTTPLADYTYDAAGRLAEIDHNTGLHTIYTYDDASRTTVVTVEDRTLVTPAVVSETTYSYDNAGNPTTMQAVDGTGLSPVTTEMQMTYDDVGRLLEVCYGDSSCDPTQSGTEFSTFTYDGVGNRLTETTSDGTRTFTYDAADQLEQITGAWGTATLSQDANGQLLDDGTRTFTYDAAGHITTIDIGGEQVAYVYDGNDNRIRKTVTDTSSSTVTSDVALVWDPSWSVPELAEQRDLVGDNTEVTYTHSPLGPLTQTTPSDGRSHLHRDALGSVVAMSDSAGSLLRSVRWSPFGNMHTTTDHTTLSTAPAVPTLGFTGELHDGESELIHLRARDHNPNLGQFTRPDPVTPPVGTPDISTYVYANNRPGVLIDPTGEYPWSSGWCVFGDNHDGSCRAAAETEETADRSSLAFGAVSLAAAGTAAVCTPCAPVAAPIAGATANAALTASAVSTAFKCNRAVDFSCVASAGITASAGTGRAAVEVAKRAPQTARPFIQREVAWHGLGTYLTEVYANQTDTIIGASK